jgi:hypothetical protein
MARKHEAVQLLKRGLSPALIAGNMQVSIGTVMGYLYNQVGEGAIRRSDILFAIDSEIRAAVETAERENGELSAWELTAAAMRVKPDAHPDDVRIYLDLRKPEVYLGDMYWMIYLIETFLHDFIKQTFTQGHGADWWRLGIPETSGQSAPPRGNAMSSLRRSPTATPHSFT